MPNFVRVVKSASSSTSSHPSISSFSSDRNSTVFFLPFDDDFRFVLLSNSLIFFVGLELPLPCSTLSESAFRLPSFLGLRLVNDPHEFIIAILNNFNKEVYRRKTARQKKAYLLKSEFSLTNPTAVIAHITLQQHNSLESAGTALSALPLRVIGSASSSLIPDDDVFRVLVHEPLCSMTIWA